MIQSVTVGVSIHASAWEATKLFQLAHGGHGVSIHASAWEATAARLADGAEIALFQSTPPRGRRHLSTAWGQLLRCFNPRLRVGGDVDAVEALTEAILFQSTPPRGRRPAQLRSRPARLPILFQSTPPRGRRLPSVPPQAALYGFQSTPPRGRRRIAGQRRRRQHQFQSTPPRGRRQSFRSLPVVDWWFQSTPPRGRRRRSKDCVSLARSSFNPRLRVGGDVSVDSAVLQDYNVSIHASAWEATVAGLSLRA